VPGPAAHLIDRALAAVAAELALRRADGVHPVALGWATVELDRAARELAGELGWSSDAFAAAPDSAALGASCRVAWRILPGGLSLVLLEPAREGRLAGTLARQGEGLVAVWLATEASRLGQATVVRAGPFGAERDAPGGTLGGLHGFLVATEPGTIRA
jgi:hypothetical protein